ncbi:MAG: zinc ribbon domain-containing protein [Acidobacteria bacterium]|nr:zinc ribbon domain-containing protein [Acidobacteriota bacterium]MBI3279341.1 zinc ribbon domain-containing protein [Acidobacteriota bacterium]
MPLYEYQCDSCGQVFEIIQRFSDAPLSKHDGCGGRVERLLSAPALQFKGTGWYVTDYARSGKSTNGADGKSETRGGTESKSGKTEGKSEAKPAPAPVSKPAAPSGEK